jgi:hypothetical protein
LGKSDDKFGDKGKTAWVAATLAAALNALIYFNFPWWAVQDSNL